MKAMNETEINESTPEQLLQILEAQLAFQRSQRAKSSRNRAIFLVAGILMIVLGAGGALLVLNQILLDLRQSDRATMTAPGRSVGNF